MRTIWSPVRSLPGWAFELTPAWVREVQTIIRHTGARLILDLNLVTATPATAARWARIAEAALPAHSIIGFEIGHEPDLYSRLVWHAAIAGPTSRRLHPMASGAFGRSPRSAPRCRVRSLRTTGQRRPPRVRGTIRPCSR